MKLSKKARARAVRQMVATLNYMQRRTGLTVLGREATEELGRNAHSFTMTWTLPGRAAVAGDYHTLAPVGTTMGYQF